MACYRSPMRTVLKVVTVLIGIGVAVAADAALPSGVSILALPFGAAVAAVFWGAASLFAPSSQPE